MNRIGLFETINDVFIPPVFPDYKPEDSELPLATYAHITDMRTRSQKGVKTGSKDTWRITLYAKTRQEIDTLLADLETLDNYANQHFSKIYILSVGDRPEVEGDNYLVTYIDIQTTNR